MSKQKTFTINSGKDLSKPEHLYRAITFNGDAFANTANEAMGNLVFGAPANANIEVAYFGLMQFRAASDIKQGDFISVSSGGYYSKAASGSYAVGRCIEHDVSAGCIGQALFNFTAYTSIAPSPLARSGKANSPNPDAQDEPKTEDTDAADQPDSEQPKTSNPAGESQPNGEQSETSNSAGDAQPNGEQPKTSNPADESQPNGEQPKASNPADESQPNSEQSETSNSAGDAQPNGEQSETSNPADESQPNGEQSAASNQDKSDQ